MSGGGVDNQYQADLDFWGVPDDQRPAPPADLEIFAENWDTVQLFVKLQTQWRVSPTGHRTGLVYASIGPTAEYAGVTLTPTVFDGLQFMEIVTINEIFKNANRPKRI